MPIYEYQCSECENRHEALQKISDAPLVDCPACGKPALKKLVSAAGFRLKGGGWYETDFKTGDKKHLAESESPAKSDGDGKTGSAGKDKSEKATAEKPKQQSKPAATAKSADNSRPG